MGLNIGFSSTVVHIEQKRNFDRLIVVIREHYDAILSKIDFMKWKFRL